MKLALIGAGQRGMTYSTYAHDVLHDEIVAIAELNDERRAIAAKKLGVPEDRCYRNADEFLSQDKCADAVIIATMDQDHYAEVMKAMDIGYDILLEKPISPNVEECIEIQKKAHKLGRKITVCHVLRYTAFFSTIKEIIDSGEIGKIISINHSENIGNYHIAHSFVRGNWSNSKKSSPIIMQKSCHDMDILVWLTNSKAKKISSFGSLTYFKEENAPANSTDRCLDCPVAEGCRFDARKAYLPVMGEWPATVLTADQTEEGLLEAMRTGPYGRCVYRCDNDVCDHQVTIIEFENGVTATFHLCGMTNLMHRTIHIMCENGEIIGDDAENVITVTKFRSNGVDSFDERTIHIGSVSGAHGGGDEALVNEFIKNVSGDDRSSIDQSIESHVMACAAEKARLTGEVIDLDAFKESLCNR